MQHSAFNIVVPQEKGALIYNTATAAFAKLDAAELIGDSCHILKDHAVKLVEHL